MRKLFNLALATISFLLIVAFANAEEIVITGNLPPYSYMENDQHKGVAADIVKEIINRIGHNHPPIIYPWPRALKKSKVSDNIIIFPLGRIPAREKEYLWVGPIVNDHVVFYNRANDKKEYSSLDDLKNETIGVLRGAPPEIKLKKLGFTGLDSVTNEQTNLRKLEANRINSWFVADLIGQHTIRQQKKKMSDYRVSFVAGDLIFYIGMSLNMKDLAQKWQKILDSMKADGTYAKILKDNFIKQ